LARPSAKGPSSRIVNRGTMRRGSPVEFFRETFSELRKSVWPTREETVRLTAYVLALSGVIMLMLSLLDYGLTQTFVRYIIR